MVSTPPRHRGFSAFFLFLLANAHSPAAPTLCYSSERPLTPFSRVSLFRACETHAGRACFSTKFLRPDTTCIDADVPPVAAPLPQWHACRRQHGKKKKKRVNNLKKLPFFFSQMTSGLQGRLDFILFG